SMSFNLAALGLPATGSASDFAILINNGTDFSTGSTPHTTGASLVGNILTFTNVSLANDNYFTLAATNLIQPGGLSGASYWYKAGAGVVGTTDVSQWTDQTGNNRNAVQVTTSLQPTLVTNSINFNPVVDFNTTTDIMNVTTAPVALNSTIFIAASPR